MTRRTLAIAAVTMCCTGRAFAAAPALPSGSCRSVLAAKDKAESDGIEADAAIADKELASCDELARRIADSATPAALSKETPSLASAAAVARIAPEDVRPLERPITPGTEGSEARAEASTDVRPCEMTGGTVSIAGTAIGARALTAVCLNPAGLVTANSASGYAPASRAIAAAILLPFNLESIGSPDTVPKFDYIGFRLNVNALGWGKGAEIISLARAKTEKAVKDAVTATSALRARIASALESAKGKGTLDACYDTLLAPPDVPIARETCGVEILVDAADLNVAEEALRRALREEVEAADQWYLGANLRVDIGDPTGEGTSRFGFTGSLAAGGTFRRKGRAAWGARAGLDYRDRDLPNSVSADAAIDFRYVLPFNDALTVLAAGVEGRFRLTSGHPDDVDSNFVDVKIAVTVPIAGSSGVTIGLSLPIWSLAGGRTPLASVSLDWALLNKLNGPRDASGS